MRNPNEPVHPIQERFDLSDRDRIHRLEVRLAQLWDEVWWHQVPWPRRFWYWLQGFRSPIERFYND